MYLKHFFSLLLTWMLLLSCSDKKVIWVAENNHLYKDYIAAYSSEQLDRGSGFTIEFTKAVVDMNEIGKVWSDAKFEIQPELQGEFIWITSSRIEFRPKRQSDISVQNHNLTLDLKSLFPEIQDELRWAGFRFHYIPLSILVKWGIPRVDLTDPHKMYVSAQLRLNDKVEPEALQKMIRIEGPHANDCSINVHPSEQDPDIMELMIGNIQKMDQAYELLMSLELPEDIKSPSIKKEKLIIPSKSEFTITGIERMDKEAAAYKIYFSNLLDPLQDIQGLIQVDTFHLSTGLNKEKDCIQLDLSEAQIPKEGKFKVLKLVRSASGQELNSDHWLPYNLVEQKPQIRFVSNGSVLPFNEQLILPFEAINLKAIDVEVFKIFKNNVLYDLHLNFSSQNDNYQLVRLGRVVKQQTIQLENLSPGSNRDAWKRYGLDLSKLIATEPGAMYQLRLSFRPSYTEYICAQKLPEIPEDFFTDDSGDPKFKSTWRDFAYYDYLAGYDYGSADDPCSLSYYYSEHFAKRTLYASNLGISVKSMDMDGICYTFVYDLQSGKPLKNVNIKLYDKQLQLLKEGLTDASGMHQASIVGNVMYATAEWNQQIAYLELEPGKSISQSEFETEGVLNKDGIKISVYTERGVWRPGDTIYLNAILFDETHSGQKFPVNLTVLNPKGKLIYKSTLAAPIMGLYAFKIPIDGNDITGTYIAKINCGQLDFHKNLQVETIKPNNIKVNWDLKENTNVHALKRDFSLQALWLHGQEAASLDAQIKLKYKLVEPYFEKYRDYKFINPETPVVEGELEVFKGNLDQNGKFITNGIDLPLTHTTGDIKGNLISLITESSGILNTDYYPLNIQMFDEYLGIQIPEGPYGYKSLERGKPQSIKIVAVSASGQALSGRTVIAELYKVSHEWWYEMRTGFPSYYQGASLKTKIKSEKLTTDRNGIASFNIQLDEYDRYFVKLIHQNNQYQTGDYFYTGWPSDDKAKNFVNILHFKADKDLYQIGEVAHLTLPGASAGTYTINIIKGNKIIKSEMIAASAGQTTYQISLESGMAPNIYVDVSYIQPCQHKLNDLPLRLFGIIPLKIEDKDKKLLPKLVMPELLKPDESFVVEVSEEMAKEFAYQLFIVDEGLLNLTRFKTPKPYDDLMAKEALALMTWDNYDEVIGNLDGEFEKIFSIGGDMGLNSKELNNVKRFKPVILASGPHVLEKGKKNKHTFKLENYTGAVRVMLIANSEKAAGSVEKSVPVKKELMIQLALPRSLSYNDLLSVPVTVFVTDPKLKSIHVQLHTNGPIQILDKSSKQIQVDRTGEHVIYFKVRANGELGVSNFKVTAEANGIKAQHEIQIKIDNPNPETHKYTSLWIEAGKAAILTFEAYGMQGTRKIVLEVSTLKGMSMKYMTERLIQYPHGCLEQTLSALFPQSLLHKLLDLNQEDKNKINANITTGIDKLRRFQQANGGFSYWSGMLDVSEWNTTYAGHFLISAKNSGFYIPGDMLDKWYKYQSSSLNAIETKDLMLYPWKQKVLAYKLFSLALYGKPAYAAMNLMYQLKERNTVATAFLSAAYFLSGKQDLALKLLASEAPIIATYREYDQSFGSTYRDEAVYAQVFSLIGKKQEAYKLLSRILDTDRGIEYLNTQELSFVLQAVAELYGQKLASPIKFDYQWNGKNESIHMNSNYFSVDLNTTNDNKLIFKNLSNLPLSVNIIQAGIEPLLENVRDMKGIQLNTKISNKSGNGKTIKPGDQLEAIVEVRLTNFIGLMNNMALTINFPSTFEVINERIGGVYTIPEGVDYQDFRDHQVKTYFDLQSGKVLRLSFPLHASFAGKFSTPLIVCESMYDPSVYARVSTPSIEIRYQ
ncbi:MAG: hypothetical protein IPM92_05355 [Saprospiraceae bacterium]|nr:hypothetical protein [Saprospiraceae bacterium]